MNTVMKRMGLFLFALYFTVMVAVALFVVGGALSAFAWSAETRVKIAIVDTGIKKSLFKSYLCEGGHADLTGKGLEDVDNHGTNIAGIIAKFVSPQTHCFILIKWYHTEWSYDRLTDNAKYGLIAKAIWAAINSGAKFINMSLEGGSNLEERDAIEYATNQGIHVIVAAGNDKRNLDVRCNVFPACYVIFSDKFHVVGNWNGLHRDRYSNFGRVVTERENGNKIEGGGIVMSGTSQSTAVFTGKLAKTEWLKSLSPAAKLPVRYDLPVD